MNREQLMRAVEQEMPAKRWEHTLGVMESAVQLASRYGADPGKAELAAILHDVAKYWPVEKQRLMIVEHGLPRELLDYDAALWHAHVGAFVARRDFGVDDEEVLDAIRYHTSGRVQMTKLEKVVCLADYIEPGRNFPGVDKLRELAQYSLEKALLAGFDGTIAELLSRGKKIFPLTLLARNALLDELSRQENQNEGGRS
jgi:predicted HD superfamily hydrolase involved in NAD metabolism